MGKAGKRQRKRQAAARKGLPMGGGAKQPSAEAERTLVIAKRLETGSAEERLDACVALANVFSPDEEEDEGLAALAPEAAHQRRMAAAGRKAETLDVLNKYKVFAVLDKRAGDADRHVRQQCLRALRNMIEFGGHAVCDKLVQHGVHHTALAQVVESSVDVAGDAEAIELLALALDVFAELCSSSELAAQLLAGGNGSLDRIAAMVSSDAAGPLVAENAARLLHFGMDGNVALAKLLVGNPQLLGALEAAIIAGNQPPCAMLHCVAAIRQAACLAQQPAALDPAKACATQLEICTKVLATESAAPAEAKQLALETLTNSCAQHDEADAGLATAVSDLFAQNEALGTAIGGILSACEQRLAEAAPDSTQSDEPFLLAANAVGLLDNLVQNTSTEAIAAKLGTQRLWAWGLGCLSSGVARLAQAPPSEYEEALQAASASLLWTLIRRAAEHPSLLTLSPEHFDALLRATSRLTCAEARSAIVGCVAALATAPGKGLDAPQLRKAAVALGERATDRSRLVALRALDGLIDMFSADERHGVFVEAGVMGVLRTATPRLEAAMCDSRSGLDQEELEATCANLRAFMQYKANVGC